MTEEAEREAGLPAPMDLSVLSPVLSDLDAVLIRTEEWALIQRSRFDFRLEAEPYHACQIYLKPETEEYIVRAWGRTMQKGTVSLDELESLCRTVFGYSVCPGYPQGEGDGACFGGGRFVNVDFPFCRRVATACEVMHSGDGDGEAAGRISLCAACSNLKEEEALAENVDLDAEEEEAAGDMDGYGEEYASESLGVDVNVKIEEKDLNVTVDKGEGLSDEGSDLSAESGDDSEDKDWDHPMVAALRRKKRARLPKKPPKPPPKPRSRKVGLGPKEWHPNNKTRIQCEHCPKVLAASAMKRHAQKSHMWGVFLCHRCDFHAFYPADIARHVVDRHEEMEGGVVALCADCDAEVPCRDPKVLEDHYKACINTKLNLTYRKTPSKYKEKKALNAFMCDYCGKSMSCERALQSHRYRHTGEKPFTCSFDGCGKRFRDPYVCTL